MKIVYVGPLWYGGTCLQRMETLRQLGHQILPVDTEPEDVHRKSQRLIYRVKRKLLGPSDLAKANQNLIQLLKKHNVNMLWLDKALNIRPETLNIVRQINPKTIIVGYSPDDMMAKHNQTRNFLKGISLYDIYFTTKSFNVNELQALGCPRVVFVGNAYDPKLHEPVVVTYKDQLKFGGKVGFIGAYEKERAEQLLYLAENGVSVRVWGPNWRQNRKLSHPNLKMEGRALWGGDYAKAICSFDINLAFLCKVNRDLQTTRSVEIPACGAFMLAERTDEHLSLFEEGKEAEFFSTNKELLEKVRYYLTHEEDRGKIANAGRNRCLKSGYSYRDRLSEMLSIISEYQLAPWEHLKLSKKNVCNNETK